MKNRLSAFLIISLSLLCISCDFSIADILNDKLDLTPPLYISYRTEFGKTPSRKQIQKGDVITEEMLPEVVYKANSNNSYYYYNGEYYSYDEEQTFDGWYYDEQFINKVEVGDVIEGSITLYAKWKSSNVYISFYIQNGYLEKYYSYDYYYDYRIYRDKYKIGTVLSNSNLPIPYYNYSNYLFLGWYLDPDYNTPAEGYVIESEITLYAKERYDGICTIYYSAPGFYYSDLPESKAIQAGEYLTSDYLPELYPYPEHDNWEFMGWYYDYDCTRPAQVGDEINTNITLYAKWVKTSIRIFYSSGITSNYADMPEIKDIVNNYIMVSDYLPELTPYSGYEDYMFAGWYYDWDCTREACVGDAITDDTWLYAKWVKAYYRISYGGSYTVNCGSLPEAKFAALDTIMLSDYLPDLTPDSGYEDYIFTGWYYDWDCTRKAYVGDLITDDVYLYAKWEQKYFAIYYNTSGCADEPESKVIDNGSPLTADFLPQIEPYSYYDNLVFAGWYYDSYYENQACIGDVLTDNISLFAKYDALPNGQFVEYWVFDEDVSLDYELWNGLTCVYNPTNSLTPAELQNDYYYAGEETTVYDSYSYDGVEYTNGNIIKRYYVKRLISTNNLARLLSLIYGYDFTYDLIITDSNPDVEQIASILKNDNSKRCNINLNLCDNCNQLTSIPDNCFEGVTYLRMIFLPVSLQTIGKNAFKSCTELSEMHIYPSVTLIDEGAFEDCSIAYVYYRGSVSDRENMIINDTTILNVAWFYNNY